MNALTLTQVTLPTAVPPLDPSGLRLLPKKTPRELAVEGDRAGVIRECRLVADASKPCSLKEFVYEFERLFAHYPETRLSEGEGKIVKADWRRLLGDVPADILAASVDQYLLKGERYAPNVGQFAKVVEPLWALRKALLRRAQETLRRIAAEAPQPA